MIHHRVDSTFERLTCILGVLMLATGLLSPLAGCKTDAVAGPERTSAEAPTSDIEDPAGVDLPPITIADRTEVDLVEEMIFHRAMYARLLRALATYYTEHGDDIKATWARSELSDLRRVKPYRYIRDAEVPVATLRPTDSIAEADRLYDEAHQLMRKGGHGVPALYNQETMKLALAKFKQLIDQYPTSDKIDDAAFFIAEIHKEYFEEKDNVLAAEWYRRAVQWNPNTPHPARFQLAVLYDFRMHEREKALAMYHEVVSAERDNISNVDFAQRRITQLTNEETRHARGENLEDVAGRPNPNPVPNDADRGDESTQASPPAPAVP